MRCGMNGEREETVEEKERGGGEGEILEWKGATSLGGEEQVRGRGRREGGVAEEEQRVPTGPVIHGLSSCSPPTHFLLRVHARAGGTSVRRLAHANNPLCCAALRCAGTTAESVSGRERGEGGRGEGVWPSGRGECLPHGVHWQFRGPSTVEVSFRTPRWPVDVAPVPCHR